MNAFGLRRPGRAVLPDSRSRPIVVCVVFRVSGRLRACCAGSGLNYQHAIDQAVQRAVRDDRFGGRIVAAEMATLAIELWFQTGRLRLEQLSDSLLWGDYGLELRSGRAFAFYLPSVAITQNIENAGALLARLRRKARIIAVGPEDLVRTSWLHFVQTKEGVVEFRRCRPRVANGINLSRTRLMRAVIRIGLHLQAVQGSDGSFTYTYNAHTDVRSDRTTHIVRTLGTSYAMSLLTQFLLDNDRSGPCSTIQRGTERSIVYLLRRLKRAPTGIGSYIDDDDGEGRLGCTALAILALQPPWLKEFRPQRLSLVSGLLSLQDRGGWFPSHVSRHNRLGNQDFYPGEALLALAREYQISPTPQLRSALRSAFPFYRKYFSKPRRMSSVPWQAKAWATAHDSDPRRGYSRFVLDQLDALLHQQYFADETIPSDFLGGFVSNGRPKGSKPTFITALFTESLIYGMNVAAKVHSPRLRRYRLAAIAGLEFLLRLQIDDEPGPYVPNPALAAGAITHDLGSFEVRCDYNLHAITCLLAALASDDILRAVSRPPKTREM
jgi:hypothetical protein